MSKSAANRYAKALFSISEEKQSTQLIFEDMQFIVATMAAHKSLRTVLASPIIEAEKKLDVVQAVFKSLQDQSLKLMQVLTVNRRIQLLGLVAQSFVEIVELANNIQHADVTTAVALSLDQEKEIQAKINELTGAEAELSTHVNPDLLGGFVLNLKDLQYDASVATQLQKVKRELVNQ